MLKRITIETAISLIKFSTDLDYMRANCSRKERDRLESNIAALEWAVDHLISAPDPCGLFEESDRILELQCLLLKTQGFKKYRPKQTLPIKQNEFLEISEKYTRHCRTGLALSK